MRNLIGDEADGWRDILADPAAHLHLYGKSEARPGRKMGHVTRLLERLSPPPAPGEGPDRSRLTSGLLRRARGRVAAGAPGSVITSIGRPSRSSCGRTARRVADHDPDEVVGIDVARARSASSICAVMPR